MAKAPKPTTTTTQISKSLDELKKSIEKAHGEGSVMLGSDSIVHVESFPTGVASIDSALGIGGLPQGRIIEIFGLESSGKTTTCLQFTAACQRHYFQKKERNGVVAFIDVEHAYDPDWAAKCGVNVNDVLFSQPNSGEEAIDIAERMTKSGLVDLIIIDSVSALVPQAELDGEISDSHIGAQARLMSKAMRKLNGPANSTGTTIAFINQIRHKIGVMFGNPETTSGGLALKFYASIRAQISKGSAIKCKDVIVGYRPSLKIIKNKCAKPFTKAEYDICFGLLDRPVNGIDVEASLIDVAVEQKVIARSGNWFNYNDIRLGQSMAAASSMLRGDVKLHDEIREKIYSSLNHHPSADDELADSILDEVHDES